jgi:polysaccharide export outer membrane protein
MPPLVLGLALVVASCATNPPYDYRKEPDPRHSEYVIGIPDQLRITVWKYADLSTDAHVRPDGTITMPLIGDLRAAGRTPSQLKQEIVRRLATYVKEEGAVVTVAVTEVASYRFVISGNVEHGGAMNARSYVTIAEAIGMAGGLNRFADPGHVVILRPGDAGIRRIPVNLNDIKNGTHLEQNLVLMAGDTVFVP